MRLYVSIGPNPRIVRMYAAERGIALQEIWIDLAAGENRREPFLSLNPAGQLPVLEIGPGQIIAESLTICEYLDEAVDTPSPHLIGCDPFTRARTRMWLRRIEERYSQPVTAAFRYGPGLAMFGPRLRCLPEAAEGMAALVRDGEAWLDAQLPAGGFVAADMLTLADIALYCFMDFAINRAGLPPDPKHSALSSWFVRMDAQVSAQLTKAHAKRA